MKLKILRNNRRYLSICYNSTRSYSKCFHVEYTRHRLEIMVEHTNARSRNKTKRFRGQYLLEFLENLAASRSRFHVRVSSAYIRKQEWKMTKGRCGGVGQSHLDSSVACQRQAAAIVGPCNSLVPLQVFFSPFDASPAVKRLLNRDFMPDHRVTCHGISRHIT